MMGNIFVETQTKNPAANWATVTAVSDDGLNIRIDGEATASTKKYKYNKAITFVVGDRVKIFRDSGTIVVEYAI